MKEIMFPRFNSNAWNPFGAIEGEFFYGVISVFIGDVDEMDDIYDMLAISYFYGIPPGMGECTLEWESFPNELT